MKLSLIRDFANKRAGGMKQLAADIGMSEQNLHRCVNNNKIQASDLELIAVELGVDITIFFDKIPPTANIYDNHENKNDNNELISLCKTLVKNYQQRDDVMNKLVSMINRI